MLCCSELAGLREGLTCKGGECQGRNTNVLLYVYMARCRTFLMDSISQDENYKHAGVNEREENAFAVGLKYLIQDLEYACLLSDFLFSPALFSPARKCWGFMVVISIDRRVLP